MHWAMVISTMPVDSPHAAIVVRRRQLSICGGGRFRKTPDKKVSIAEGSEECTQGDRLSLAVTRAWPLHWVGLTVARGGCNGACYR